MTHVAFVSNFLSCLTVAATFAALAVVTCDVKRILNKCYRKGKQTLLIIWTVESFKVSKDYLIIIWTVLNVLLIYGFSLRLHFRPCCPLQTKD